MGGMAWRWLASVPPTCTGLDSQARFHSRSSCDDATLRSLELGGSQLESSSRARRISTLTPKSSSTASRGATPKGAFPHGRAVAKRLGWDDVRVFPTVRARCSMTHCPAAPWSASWNTSRPLAPPTASTITRWRGRSSSVARRAPLGSVRVQDVTVRQHDRHVDVRQQNTYVDDRQHTLS